MIEKYSGIGQWIDERITGNEDIFSEKPAIEQSRRMGYKFALEGSQLVINCHQLKMAAANVKNEKEANLGKIMRILTE